MASSEMSGIERQTWTRFHDQLEAALRALAERMVSGAAIAQPGWQFLAPPGGPVPAELTDRHDRLLAQLELLTEAAQVRMSGLRGELDSLPHHSPSPARAIAVGRTLDILG
jgi:hypothetical protein